MIEEPVLRLPNPSVSYKVYIDASNYAIGEVLMQQGHLMVY